jgi:glycosyltransferase involved in cell wall biosynthesis
MRVSFLNRGLHSHPGGDLIQIEETAAALRRKGVWVHIESEDPQYHTPHLSSVDLAHIFHVNFSFSRANWQHCLKARIPYVLTPLYYDADKLGMTYEEQKEMLAGAAKVTPFTAIEAGLIHKCTGYGGNDRIIPNGTGTAFHDTSDPLQRSGVLAVAARAGSKGTDAVRDLCAELGYPFTLGQGVAKGDMPDLYKKHRVFVHAADLEVMSLVIGEALCANCRVLATNTNPGNVWYPGVVEFSPHMPAGKDRLRELLKGAYEGEAWNYGPNVAARRLTWDSVADDLIKVYKEVLHGRT